MNTEVRTAVQRALDKLINRFGNQSEVIEGLRTALRQMDKEEAPASSGGTEAAVVEAEADSSPASAPQQKQAVKAEPPPQTRKGMGRKGK